MGTSKSVPWRSPTWGSEEGRIFVRPPRWLPSRQVDTSLGFTDELEVVAVTVSIYVDGFPGRALEQRGAGKLPHGSHCASAAFVQENAEMMNIIGDAALPNLGAVAAHTLTASKVRCTLPHAQPFTCLLTPSIHERFTLQCHRWIMRFDSSTSRREPHILVIVATWRIDCPRVKGFESISCT